MIGYQDDIIASYRKSCTDLKERLQGGLGNVYCRDECHNVGQAPNEYSRIFDATFDPMVLFEQKLFQFVKIKQEYQNESTSLQMKIKELQIDVRAKNSCLVKLKNDIASHYVQIEFLRKHNEKLERDLESTSRELKNFRKSQEWLKKYLCTVNNTKDERKVIPQNNEDNSREYNNEVEKQWYSDLIQEKEIVNQCIKNHNGNDIEYIFHTELMKICHENYYLKQALQKLGNMNEREANLNRVFKFANTNSSMTSFKDIQEGFNNELVAFRQSDKIKNCQIHQRNAIIDSLKIEILQMELDKQNMQFSVFKLREYFMKIKDIQTKLKPTPRDLNHSSTFPKLGKVSASSGNRKFVLDLMENLECSRLEKVQMEENHHEELCKFREKFVNMQFFLDHMKTVCDNVSEDSYEEYPEIFSSKNEIHGNNTLKQTSQKVKSNTIKIKEKSSDIPLPKSNFSEGMKLSDMHIKYFQRKISKMERKYRRIDSTCDNNMEILKQLNNQMMVTQLRNMKVQAMVNARKTMEQRTRFEKYKRLLLSTIRQYRKSCTSKEKRIEKLQSFYIPIASDLKLLLNNISYDEENPYYKNHINQKNILKGAIERLNKLVDEIMTFFKPEIFANGARPKQNDNNEIVFSPMEKNCQGDCSIRNDSVSILVPKQESKEENHQIENYISSLHYSLNLSYSEMKKVEEEKMVLQAGIRQRDNLLKKIFFSFKERLENLAVNVNEKYFLQRLCIDLRSVNKLYGSQNEILKGVLENNNICPKSILVRKFWSGKTIIDKEKGIQELLARQRHLSDVKDDFCDIQLHLDSMKNDISLIQNVLHKR